MTDYSSFYDTAADTKYKLARQSEYVDHAITNGDQVYINEKGQVVITIRKKIDTTQTIDPIVIPNGKMPKGTTHESSPK